MVQTCIYLTSSEQVEKLQDQLKQEKQLRNLLEAGLSQNGQSSSSSTEFDSKVLFLPSFLLCILFFVTLVWFIRSSLGVICSYINRSVQMKIGISVVHTIMAWYYFGFLVPCLAPPN